MVTILISSALLLYLVASGVLARSFAGGGDAGPRTGTMVAALGVALHGAALAAFTALHNELPLVGLAPSLATLGFLIGVFLLVTTITNARPVGLVLVPVMAVLAGLALVLGLQPTGEDLAFRGVWFAFHVLAAFIGYAGLTVAFAAGLLYLLQFRELKGKRLGRIFRFFPALPTLDLLGRWSVAIGFATLTLALLLGWGWTVRFQQTLAPGNPQVIWGVITWFAFAAMLGARAWGTAGRERRAALASVIGFTVVVLVYVVLRLSVVAGSVFL
ncbi:MAG TPA: cytochrome c biogenesis protein CcsA [Longimicrobiales bacterium]|nr:cytochrome c biogenesis protein CcsA [Longimicrobiales bacterium]